MRSPAMLEAMSRPGARAPFPVLRVPLVARGFAIRTIVASPIVCPLDGGAVTHEAPPAEWDTIEYGSGLDTARLEAVRTSVGVVDADGSLLSELDAYDPRGSAAAIDWALPDLVAEDWEPLFRGVLEDWEQDGAILRLIVKTDDTALRTPIPAAVVLRTEWGTAAEGTIYGTAMPLVTGVHDAFQVTARGMVPAVNIRYDENLGYWWAASVGNLVEIRRIYYDGVVQPSNGWTTLRGVYGSNAMTIIAISPGYQPARGVVVSFDCEGPDEDGLAVGPSVTNPVTTLRSILEEYAYRRAPVGAYRGPHPIIDATSWDAAAAFFTRGLYDCARRFGGDQEETISAAEVVQTFLDAYPWCRIDWTELGTLAFTILDPDDVDPDDAAWVELQKTHKTVPYRRGDKREVYSHVRMPFMWSSSERKFQSSYEAHDVAALPEPNTLVIENPWSQARYLLE